MPSPRQLGRWAVKGNTIAEFVATLPNALSKFVESTMF